MRIPFRMSEKDSRVSFIKIRLKTNTAQNGQRGEGKEEKSDEYYFAFRWKRQAPVALVK